MNRHGTIRISRTSRRKHPAIWESTGVNHCQLIGGKNFQPLPRIAGKGWYGLQAKFLLRKEMIILSCERIRQGEEWYFTYQFFRVIKVAHRTATVERIHFFDGQKWDRHPTEDAAFAMTEAARAKILATGEDTRLAFYYLESS